MAIILPNSVFFHIPKTGGTFISSLIKASGVEYTAYEPKFYEERGLFAQHVTPDNVPWELMGDRKRFAFVRNPMSWYQSMFAFRSMAKWQDDRTSIIDKMCRTDDFDSFVNRMSVVFPGGYVSEMYKSFLGENLDKVHFIGRQEVLRGDLIDFFAMSGDKISTNLILNHPMENRAASNKDWIPNVQFKNETGNLLRKVENWAYEKLNYA